MNHLPAEVPPTYGISYAPVRAYHEQAVGNTLLTLWRRRRVIIGAVVLCLMAAGGALVVLHKNYTAQATIQLDLGQREATPFNEQPAGVTLDASAIVQGEASIIRSRMIARRVVQQMGLENDVTGQSWWQGIASLLGQQDASSGDPAKDRIEAGITAMLSHLAVTTDNRTYLIEISYTAGDPATAARVANAFAQEYLQRRTELNTNLTGHVTAWLRGEIDATTGTLNQAEQAVLAYRQKMHMVDAGVNGETVYQQQLRDLNTQLTAATLARVTEENRAARVKQMVAGGTPPSAADLPGSSMIQDLLEQETTARQRLEDIGSNLGSQNPQLAPAKAALASLRAAVSTQMRNAVVTTQANAAAAARIEQDLHSRLDALQKTMVAEKANEVALVNLQAKAQTIRQRLVSLSQDYDRALLNKNLQLVAGSLAIQAEAVPIPSFPKPMIVIALGLVGGIVVGVVLVLLLERRDRGFRTTDEVNDLTGLPCLATLPELPPTRRRGKRRPPTPVEMMFEENIRAIGSGIGLFGNAEQCRVVLVTSSLPTEGKSVICQALARVLAGVGHRVLLIDGARSEEPGQDRARSNEESSPVALLGPSGEEPARFIHRGLSLMSDVFGPEKLDQLIDEARKHFDIVVIDGAPVMLFADSFVIARKADTVVHVVQWGKTLKSTVMTALRRLQEQSVRVDAAVLARVEPSQARGFASPDQWTRYRARPSLLARLARRRRAPPQSPVWAPQPAERGSSRAA
jgi:polysaccharide biosynthesis transport protein